MGRRKKAKGGDGYFHRKTRKEGGKDIPYGNWLTKFHIVVTDENGKKKRVARYVNHGTDDYNLAMAKHLEWLKLYQSGSLVEYEQTLTVRAWATNWLTKKRDDANAFGTVKGSTIARYDAIIAGFLAYTDATGLRACC